jgi:hypothetical protein
MTNTDVRVLKIRNLTEPQVAAFAELFPVLTATEKLDGTKVVETSKSTIRIELRPGIFRRGPEPAAEQLVASGRLDRPGLISEPARILLNKLESGDPKHVILL